eukprot:15364995-Ditylum_brightwellii.AAC.1
MGEDPLARCATVSSCFLQMQHRGWMCKAIAMIAPNQLAGSLPGLGRRPHAVVFATTCFPVIIRTECHGTVGLGGPCSIGCIGQGRNSIGTYCGHGVVPIYEEVCTLIDTEVLITILFI